jgi:hypothetical protein
MSWAMRQGSQLSKFPLNDPEHRNCLLRNVCFLEGNLTFFKSTKQQESLSQVRDYLPEGFNGKMFHVGHLRAFTIPIHTVEGDIDEDLTWSDKDVTTALDANSWSFNYGHYVIDNVLPVFTACKLFNLPFNQTQQLFETKCRQFTTLDASFANRKIDYNHSLGTYREGCLSKIVHLSTHFFNHAPQFLDELALNKDSHRKISSVCYRRMIVGHGSTFGLKSVG